MGASESTIKRVESSSIAWSKECKKTTNHHTKNQDRAKLAKKILLTLDRKDSESDSKNENYWIKESQRRSDEYKAGKVSGKQADQVLNDMRKKFR